MYMYMYVYMYIYICICICIFIYVYVYVYIYMYMYIYVYVYVYVRPKAKEKNDPKVQRFHTFAKRGDACHKCYNCQRCKLSGSSSICDFSTFFLFLARCFSKLGYTKTIGFQFSCLISGCFWGPHVENSKNHSLRRIMEVPEVFEDELAP